MAKLKPVLALLSCVIAYGVLAEESTPEDAGTQPETPPATEPGSRMIQEIVVTAQKSRQTLQDVPIAVSVVSGDDLKAAGVFGPEGIEDRVPNVELDTDAQAPTIGIRGFSTDSYNVGLEPSVGIVIDEIPLGRSEFIPDGLFDLDRVEILRGPQGTLFGKNTIAGVLIFTTAEAEPERQAGLTVTGGEHDAQRIEGFFNLPIGDSFATRAALVDWNDGGEVDNSFLNRRELETEQLAGRLKFEWNPLDRLKLRFGGQTSETETTYSGWQLYETDPNALAYAQSKDPETEDNPFDGHTSFNLPGFVKRDTTLVHAIAEYELNSNIDMMVIGGHGSLENDILMDFDVSAADLANVGAIFNHEQDSLELRFVGGLDAPFGDRIEFVGGLFGYKSEMDIAVDVALGTDAADFAVTPAGGEALGLPTVELIESLLIGLPIPGIDFGDGVHQTFDQSSESTAAFGQITWYFTERFSGIMGLRYGREEKDATLRVQDRGPGIVAMIVQSENFTQGLSRDESETSPKLGLAYEFSDDVSSYVSWTRGSKSGGFNAISFQNQNLSFEPEQGDNYEAGVKSRLLDGALGLNVTVYQTDVTDMQVVNFNGIGFDVFNAAEAKLEGIEADLQWLTPWKWLSINSAFAVSSAEYESYPNAPAPAGGGDANGEQDLSGETLPKAPKYTASLAPTVTLPLAGDLGLVFGLNVSRRGEQFLTLDLDPVTRQEAYTLVDAHIGIGPEDGAWGLTLRGENLTDTEALNFVADHNLYANSYFASQIPLKRISLSLNANWW